jgi:ribonuclease HI
VATTHIISSAIVIERSEEGHAFGVQRPMYFVNEVLSESRVRYPAVQKLLYGILITSRKLHHYFEEYQIIVITDYPLADILHNQDATGRISKWAVELGALSIDFKPRTAIKSQALVDFMAEWRENQVPNPVDKPEHWTMYFDGSLKLDGGGAGVLFISPRGEQLKYVLQILWEVSNNEAEYEALLHGFRLAISLGIKRLLVYGNSLLVVQQVNKEWDCNKETMEAYVQEVCKLENKFSGLEVHHVLREHNVATDTLSKLGSTRAQVPVGVFVQELKQPSIRSSPQVSTGADSVQPDREVMLVGEDWRGPFIDFIWDHVLPAGMDPKSAAATRVMRRSKGFVLVEDKLYRRGARSGVLMKCVTTEEGLDILREIHEGVCGNHAASKSLVGKPYKAGFWWPTAVSDAEDLVLDVRTASSLASKLMSRPTPSLLYRLPGRSPAGASTWLGPSQRRQEALLMFWWLSTSSPSGSSTSRSPSSHPTGWSTSSLIFCIVSASPTLSSQIWAQISQPINFGSSVRIHPSTSSTYLWHTHGQMGKSNGQTA